MAAKLYLPVCIFAAGAILVLAGCSVVHPSSESLFLQNGIPAEHYRVGGGFQIRYIAPEAGVVYLVEHRSYKLLGTESLLRNQVFEFFPTEEVVDGFYRVGIDLSEGEFVIYFVPASKLYHR